MQRIIVYLGIIITSILLSCTNPQEYKKIKNDFADVTYNCNYENIDSIYSKIPNYSEISKTINSLHTKFDPAILLNIENLDLIDNSKVLSLTLGMCIADLAYARHFERVQKCKEILISITKISKKLAISKDELNNNIIILENRLNEKETLFEHIDSLMSSKDKHLNDTEKFGISALIISGFWIESTHIGLSITSSEETIKTNEEKLKSHFSILNQINIFLDCLNDCNTLKILKSELKRIEINGYQEENLLSEINNLKEVLLKRT